MSINLKNDRTDRLARELAATTGESLTDAITIAIAERLERQHGLRAQPGRLAEILRLADEFQALPVLDDRTPDEIVGYDESGLPT